MNIIDNKSLDILKEDIIRECYLCGSIDNITRDHIPPKAMFDKNSKGQLITVPCCMECNNKFSNDDEYFVQILTTGSAYLNNRAEKNLEDKVLRGISRNKRLFSYIAENMKYKEIRSESGIILGKLPGFPCDNKRIENVAEKIVKGIVYKHLKRRLVVEPELCFVNYYRNIDDKLIKPTIDCKTAEVIRMSERFIVEKGVFSYSFGHAIDNGKEAIMVSLLFYDQILFIFFCFQESPITENYTNLSFNTNKS